MKYDAQTEFILLVVFKISNKLPNLVRLVKIPVEAEFSAPVVSKTSCPVTDR
jgi:hypothetical protein